MMQSEKNEIFRLRVIMALGTCCLYTMLSIKCMTLLSAYQPYAPVYLIFAQLSRFSQCVDIVTSYFLPIHGLLQTLSSTVQSVNYIVQFCITGTW